MTSEFANALNKLAEQYANGAVEDFHNPVVELGNMVRGELKQADFGESLSNLASQASSGLGRASEWASSHGVNPAMQSAIVGGGLGALAGGGTALANPDRRHHFLSSALTGGLAGAALGGGGALAYDKVMNGPVLGKTKIDIGNGQLAELNPEQLAQAAQLAQGTTLTEKGILGGLGIAGGTAYNSAPVTTALAAPVALGYAGSRWAGENGWFGRNVGKAVGGQINAPVYGGSKSPTLGAIGQAVKDTKFMPDSVKTVLDKMKNIITPANPKSQLAKDLGSVLASGTSNLTPGLQAAVTKHHPILQADPSAANFANLEKDVSPAGFSELHRTFNVGAGENEAVRQTLRGKIFGTLADKFPTAGKYIPSAMKAKFVPAAKPFTGKSIGGIIAGLGAAGVGEYGLRRLSEENQNKKQLGELLTSAAQGKH